jgi:uncharacterized LabA/DUF88 family protein
MATMAGFVDVGFLRGGGVKALGNKNVKINAPATVAWLKGLGSSYGCSEFLRTYWYDGQLPESHIQHTTQAQEFRRIGQTPGLQMRSGYMQKQKQAWQYPLQQALQNFGVDMQKFEAATNFHFNDKYEQKGVDTLIVLDLVRLAQRRAYDTAILLCGDRDIAEAVRVAQDEGRRVVVAYPRGAGLSHELKHYADELLELDLNVLNLLFAP